MLKRLETHVASLPKHNLLYARVFFIQIAWLNIFCDIYLLIMICTLFVDEDASPGGAAATHVTTAAQDTSANAISLNKTASVNEKEFSVGANKLSCS